MRDKMNILETYRSFEKKQRQIIDSLRETKGTYTKDDLQNAIAGDNEAKELLQEIKLIINE